jgi:histidinol-phosphate/aromatic aminotransferase/cobyric acid decarboxylase-like protein
MVTAPFLPAGAHGGDGARLALQLGIPEAGVLDLSASHNPVAPDVVPLVAEHAGSVRAYPDDGPARDALAAAIGIAPERVVLTNGGAEAIALVAAARPRGWVEEPDFSLYARHLTVVERGAPRWRSNPHNPTGALSAAGEHAAVWDEAFYPLATGTWTRGDADRGSIVVGSLTKVFACPGLRAGYVLAPDDRLACQIRCRQPQWSVNALVCAVLPQLLATAALPEWAHAVCRLRGELVTLLRAHGLQPSPSDGNYVLVRDAPGVRDHLARHAVLVRDTASFGWPGGVRVAVPDEAGLERLAGALEGWSPA